ncbi:sensor histidine kinase [Acetobacterium woodii]|uniref:histidine kinase n=1 Tax=Acetobacterium woodii (strain ATCC 29683 / DSM 1030 / JCM 2381 / KCTC 1655 / WB1) TaxID=931626 RepID=H6LHE8_ACEWD|nr:HAMP domain-containing sensor histidine kinase [Acetobacterium woodii]AFA49658.1 putative sensory transduction histidine kinase [Acetobacterium woodii DSM 1030]
MSIFGTRKTLNRLNEMIDDAIAGNFTESNYDESQLSRLESKWMHYLSASKMSMVQTNQERENIKSMVSDISHQTKTPLANILLYTELLNEQVDNQENLKLVEQISMQTQKLDFLIQSLVKMSRLESNIIELNPQKQPVKPLLEQALSEIMPKARQKQMDITVENAEAIQACYDLKWTSEALYNILDNAVKYSEAQTSITIHVKMYELVTCIAVEDQGSGIAPDEKAQIFQRFYRSSGIQQKEGIGIGLYLAREIMQKQKGYIKVTSTPKKGSIFSLYLPT